MSDTHPNAYHAEAAAERILAAQHAGRANELEAEAERREVELGITKPKVEEPVETEAKEEPVPENKPSIFNSKR